VTPSEYSRGTDPNKENDMEGRKKNKWSIFSCYSQHKYMSQRVLIVILNAILLAYLITAAVYFNSQGKFNKI
jgi:hypothetical protein